MWSNSFSVFVFSWFFLWFSADGKLAEAEDKALPPPQDPSKGGSGFRFTLALVLFFFALSPFFLSFFAFADCQVERGLQLRSRVWPINEHAVAVFSRLVQDSRREQTFILQTSTQYDTVRKLPSNNCWYEDIITMSGWAPQYLLVFIIILPLLDLCFWTLCLLIYLTHLVLNEPHCQICKASLLSYCWLPLGGGLHLVQNWPVGLLVAPAQERRENFISSAEREKLQEKCVYFEILPNFGSCGKLRLSIAALLQRFVWWL